MGCRPVSVHGVTVLRGKDADRLYGLFNTPNTPNTPKVGFQTAF